MSLPSIAVEKRTLTVFATIVLLLGGALAYFQVAFMDAKGGYTGDVTQLPKGRILTGVNDWSQDAFEAVAPPTATAAEIRVFMTGKGRVWVKDIMVFS